MTAADGQARRNGMPQPTAAAVRLRRRVREGVPRAVGRGGRRARAVGGGGGRRAGGGAYCALGKIGQFEPGTHFAAWMAQMVRFVALNHLRKQTRTQAAPLDENDPQARTPHGRPGNARPGDAPLHLGSHGELPPGQQSFDDELKRGTGRARRDGAGMPAAAHAGGTGLRGDRPRARHPRGHGHEPRTPKPHATARAADPRAGGEAFTMSAGRSRTSRSANGNGHGAAARQRTAAAAASSLDAYLDGRLGGPERTAFEARLGQDPALAAGLEAQRQHRRFAAADVRRAALHRAADERASRRTAGRAAEPVHAPARRGSGRGGGDLCRVRRRSPALDDQDAAPRRADLRRGADGGVVGGVQRAGRPPAELRRGLPRARRRPARSPPSTAGFASACSNSLGHQVAVTEPPAGVEVLGVGEAKVLSPKTVVLRARVDGQDVLLFADRAANDDGEAAAQHARLQPAPVPPPGRRRRVLRTHPPRRTTPPRPLRRPAHHQPRARTGLRRDVGVDGRVTAPRAATGAPGFADPRAWLLSDLGVSCGTGAHFTHDVPYPVAATPARLRIRATSGRPSPETPAARGDAASQLRRRAIRVVPSRARKTSDPAILPRAVEHLSAGVFRRWRRRTRMPRRPYARRTLHPDQVFAAGETALKAPAGEAAGAAGSFPAGRLLTRRLTGTPHSARALRPARSFRTRPVSAFRLDPNSAEHGQAASGGRSAQTRRPSKGYNVRASSPAGGSPGGPVRGWRVRSMTQSVRRKSSERGVGVGGGAAVVDAVVAHAVDARALGVGEEDQGVAGGGERVAGDAGQVRRYQRRKVRSRAGRRGRRGRARGPARSRWCGAGRG